MPYLDLGMRRISNRNWKARHQEYIQESHQKYVRTEQHRTRNAQRMRDQRKNHPEKMLKLERRWLSKLGKQINKTALEYHAALYLWAKAIKKLANYRCAVCGDKAEHAHHLFHKNEHPELSLNENNGVALCKLHHNELHGRGL